jgi:hypothetical protein
LAGFRRCRGPTLIDDHYRVRTVPVSQGSDSVVVGRDLDEAAVWLGNVVLASVLLLWWTQVPPGQAGTAYSWPLALPSSGRVENQHRAPRTARLLVTLLDSAALTVCTGVLPGPWRRPPTSWPPWLPGQSPLLSGATTRRHQTCPRDRKLLQSGVTHGSVVVAVGEDLLPANRGEVVG